MKRNGGTQKVGEKKKTRKNGEYQYNSRNCNPCDNLTIVKSPIKAKNMICLDKKAKMYKKLRGFDRSSSSIKLFRLFQLFNSKMLTLTCGTVKVVVEVSVTKEEADDLFSFLKYDHSTEKKISKSNKAPFHTGKFTRKKIRFQKRAQLRELFDIFENLKPKCDYLWNEEDGKKQFLSAQEYLDLYYSDRGDLSLGRCSLTLENKNSVKGNFFLCYDEYPSFEGNNSCNSLYLYFWYEIETLPKSMLLSVDRSRKYTDKDIGYVPLKEDEYIGNEDLGLINLERRAKLIKIFELTK